MVDLHHRYSFIFRATIAMLSFNNNKPRSFIHDFIHFLQSNSDFQAIKGILACFLYWARDIDTCLPISARNTNI